MIEQSLFFVEGTHDCSAVTKILRLHDFRLLEHKEELTECFRKLLPSTYPFVKDRLDRISPVPVFLQKDEKTVAIQIAVGDSQLVNSFCSTFKMIPVGFLREISFAGIILDCDGADCAVRKKKLIEKINEFGVKDANFEISVISNEKMSVYGFDFKEVLINSSEVICNIVSI